MARRTLVFIGDLGSAFRTSGGQAFSAQYLRFLMQDPAYDVRPYLATCREIDRGASPAAARSVQIELPDMNFGRITTLIPLTVALRRRIRTPPDLYVMDQPFPSIAYLQPAPAVSMFHGALGPVSVSITRLKSSANAMLVRPFLRRVYRGFFRFRIGLPMFNSHHTMESCAREASMDAAVLRPYVTHLPVETAPYDGLVSRRAAARARLGLAPSDMVIAYISNFSPAKRVHLAVEAARELLRHAPQVVKFLFVGRPITSAALEAFVAEPASRARVIRLMEVPPSEVPGLYAASDIAISTSGGESFGYSVAEAMAAGLPQVVFRVGALPELVQDGYDGFVVEALPDFVKALMRLTDSANLRHAMGRHAARSVRERFSPEAFWKQTKAILDEALERFAPR